MPVLIALLACLTIVLASVATTLDVLLRLTLWLAGGAGLVTAFVLLLRERRRTRETAAAGRVAELKQRIQYEAIAVYGGNNAVWFLLCALLAVVLCGAAVEKRELAAIIGALGFAVLSFVLALTLIPRFGKPLLTLTRQGIDLPTYGLIPWRAIDDIDVQKLRTSYGSLGHMLHLKVGTLPDRRNGMHPATRLLYRLIAFGQRRTLISIRLVRTSVPAEDVAQLSRDLCGSRRESLAVSS